jgi:hypothetical protein
MFGELLLPIAQVLARCGDYARRQSQSCCDFYGEASPGEP